uniref:Uncharacterized protein n=1 Tax=Parascaris univalens TaxID=6257 RepID=A0A915CJA4_PARUN
MFRLFHGESENDFDLLALKCHVVYYSDLAQFDITVMIRGAAGAILVHDLSNSKSEASLAQWISLLRGDSSSALTSLPSISNLRPLLADIESTPIPTLVVGCKLT